MFRLACTPPQQPSHWEVCLSCIFFHGSSKQLRNQSYFLSSRVDGLVSVAVIVLVKVRAVLLNSPSWSGQALSKSFLLLLNITLSNHCYSFYAMPLSNLYKRKYGAIFPFPPSDAGFVMNCWLDFVPLSKIFFVETLDIGQGRMRSLPSHGLSTRSSKLDGT